MSILENNISLAEIYSLLSLFVNDATTHKGLSDAAIEIRSAYATLYNNCRSLFTTEPPSERDRFYQDKKDWQYYMQIYNLSPVEEASFKAALKNLPIGKWSAFTLQFIIFVDRIVKLRRSNKEDWKDLGSLFTNLAIDKESSTVRKDPVSLDAPFKIEDPETGAILQTRMREDAEEEMEQLPNSLFAEDVPEEADNIGFLWLTRPVKNHKRIIPLLKSNSKAMEHYMPETVNCQMTYFSFLKQVRNSTIALEDNYDFNKYYIVYFAAAFKNFKENYFRITGSAEKQKKKRLNLVKNLLSYDKNFSHNPLFPDLTKYFEMVDLATLLAMLPIDNQEFNSIMSGSPAGHHYLASVIHGIIQAAVKS